MQKLLPTLLGVYAAVVSPLLLLGVVGGTQGEQASSDPSSMTQAMRKELRDTVTSARREAQKVAQANVIKQEQRLERYGKLVGDMEDGLKDLDGWIEELSKRNSGSMAQIGKDLAALRGLQAEFKKVQTGFAELAARVKKVEDRPAVIKEIIKTVAGPATPAKDTGPKGPTLPGQEEEDPAEVKAKVDKAMVGLQSKKLSILWPAIETVRKYKVLEAGPHLLTILKESKEKFARQAAATALGEIKLADAVVPLADALKDDENVAQMAAKSIRKITGFDTELSHSARGKERTRARNAVLAWWRGNEEAVRERLGQPKS